MARSLLFGTSVSPGIAIGVLRFAHNVQTVEMRRISPREVEGEQEQLRAAVTNVRAALQEAMAKVPEDLSEYREVIAAQIELARDPKLVGSALSRIEKELVCAAWALDSTVEQLCSIFRNMDANLEEAATILDTPRWKIMTRITLPMVKPAILSTILLVFGSAMGSYPVPHYLGLSTLSTKYVSMNSKYTGEASILAIIMMIFGVAIMMLNQLSLTSRKNYTTVTGKSGQISKINLGKSGKYIIAVILVILTFFTSIFPIVSFAFETFLPNPGDYSFLYTGDTSNLTAKWWVTSENVTENGMYGQKGILHNETIWHAFRGTIFVSVCCALLAGTIGTLVGYAVSKNRRSKWANYVNSMAFLPYLMPSLAVGAAFFILFSTEKLNLFNTYTLLIIVGTIKYIPFASRSSLNSMLQLSGEIEEAAIIQDIPWIKRMTRIIIPIQKSSIISGYLLPFMTCLRELSLFMLLCVQGFILSTTLDYFDEMGLYAFSSGINLILIITILVCNTLVNKVTGASLDKGIGG